MFWESEEFIRITMSPLIARLFMAETQPDNLVRCKNVKKKLKVLLYANIFPVNNNN